MESTTDANSEESIIVCGLGRAGSRVVEYLHDTELAVVVIDTVANPEDPRLKGCRLVVGDCRQREVLLAAGIERAKGVLVLTGNDLINIAATLVVRSLNSEVRVVLRMFNQNLISRLGQTVRNVHAMSISLLTAPILAMTALSGQGLGRFRLGEGSDDRRHIGELNITMGSEFVGRSLGELSKKRSIQIIAHLPTQGEAQYLLEVDSNRRLQGGDHLVVCGSPDEVNGLLASVASSEETTLHWASLIRRLGRVVWRTLSEIDRAVTLTCAILLAVVLVSTLVLHWNTRMSLATCLFRTISIMATGADMHESDYKEQDGIKVYVSVLRIIGAALMAAFTAIVTNYLIRARLQGALEVRRIPDRGHVIILGLTPVGYRVMEELLDCNTQVVVIEQDMTNRFVATARRSGAAMVIGDGTVIEVLRQAKAQTARAVVAATNNDLVNLEMALLVRDLNPTQRVVLLQSDPQLAQMLREAANVKLAVNVPALAAPAFLAALFGDRVLSVFMIQNHPMAVLDMAVKDDDSILSGQAVRALANDFGILPLAILDRHGNSTGDSPLKASLAPGNRLIGIIALPDLERLLRRQPGPGRFEVLVTQFPLTARDWLVDQLRLLRKITSPEAESLLNQLPIHVEKNLTRGQAEDLLARLQRERIEAELRAEG